VPWIFPDRLVLPVLVFGCNIQKPDLIEKAAEHGVLRRARFGIYGGSLDRKLTAARLGSVLYRLDITLWKRLCTGFCRPTDAPFEGVTFSCSGGERRLRGLPDLNFEPAGRAMLAIS
jgi:hypothetical protein